MYFILENKDKKYDEVIVGWNKLRKEIEQELLKNQ